MANRSAVGGNRSAFTLIELLIVVAIIGILVGLALPAIMAARTRAHEFAIQQELMQIDAAVEQFKTKYGFYPPDCASVAPATWTPALFDSYLAIIAPNHNEGKATVPGTFANNWWTAMGSQLNPSTSLQFWLSGIAKNKQYPLTGGTGLPLPAFNQENVGGVTIEREVFFEYDSSRYGISADGLRAIYNQARAGGNVEPIVYFEFGTKNPASVTTISTPVITTKEPSGVTLYAYQLIAPSSPAPQPPTAPVPPATTYCNYERFQLLTPGADGQFGNNGVTSGYCQSASIFERDNMTNFAPGRVDVLQN